MARHGQILGCSAQPLEVSGRSGMNLLRSVFLCAAMIGLAGASVVRAEDQPAQPNGDTAQQQPAIHCEGQNCLPPEDDPALECKGQDCTPAPATDQPAGPEIKKVK